MSEYRKIIEDYNPSSCLDNKGGLFYQRSRAGGYTAPPQPTFKDVIRVAEELKTPIVELVIFLGLIGKEKVVQGFWSQGEEKFKETLSVFSKIGFEKCIKYITILNDNKTIGQESISRDFARAPDSIARTLESIDNQEIEIEDLYLIIPQLKNSIGERNFERGFPSWSIYYFLVALQKIKKIGIDKFISIIIMLQNIFGKKYVGEAYIQGYLWFVEAIEIFSELDSVRCKDTILSFRDRSNVNYFNTSFSHNPRSFARYIQLKSQSTNKDFSFIFAEKKISGDEIIVLMHELLDNYFTEKEYLDLAPSELIAFVFDAVTKSLDGEGHAKIALFLQNKYFSGLAKRKVYSLLRGIGPEIEIQKNLSTYDVEAAHMIAFFFLVETSGDGLIEFPLGPASYHGSLSEVVSAMRQVSLGNEYLIPQNKIIPLDVSISVPPNIIHEDKFRKKATLLRVVNDLLYTAEARLASAFHAYPQDESGIRYKAGLARGIGLSGFDLVETRSANLITENGEKSVVEPLIAHERTFRLYQLMYSSLLTIFTDKPNMIEYENNLKNIFNNFERQIIEILRGDKVEYVKNIDNNKNQAFLEISYVRNMYPKINLELKNVVSHHLDLIDNEVLNEAVRRRMKKLKKYQCDVEHEILSEINIQKSIDAEYGKALENVFLGKQ